MTDVLQSLREFTVRVDYGRKHTAFDVRDGGRGKPVVRMAMDFPYHMADLLRVFPVAEPDRLLGTVGCGAAAAPDKQLLGRCREKIVWEIADSWHIEQPEIGQLVGSRKGLSRLANGYTGLSEVSAVRIEFVGPTSPAFTFVRRAGITSEYKISIHDDRVNRLLVLAWTEHFNRGYGDDARQYLIDFTTNPFQKPGPEIQAARERRKAAIQAAKQNRGHGTDPR
ncbi:hypothetical protein ABIA32_001751 [Streptacidiphilus sp. MAP12-20]|uniref:hypothetical protein n=1 Tax=Streptacidiphilus sp. MAP12-20 TaxID=3156299 RepID=UPI003518E48F